MVGSASAEVKPLPRYRDDEASIRKAVRVAREKALPLAVTAARERAVQLAAATGSSLGALVAIAEPPPVGYPFVLFTGQSGTYGPDQYCRQVRIYRSERTPAGGRRRIPTKATRKVCRTPALVSVSVSVTYTLVANPT